VASQGIDFVPAPMPLLRRTSVSLVQTGDNFLWDLCPWLPGSADYRANPSRTRLTAAMQALAQFHVAAADGQASNTGPAPAVIERIERAQQLLSGDFQRIAAAVGSGLEAALDLRAVRLLAQAHPQLANLPLRLEVIASVNLPLSPAIRDIHHDHVLFTGDKVTGLIDFGALRIDTPLADIARLVGSLVGDDQPAREFALNAYRELRPLSRQEHGHIDVLDRSGLVLGGLNWLRWLYLDRRDMGPLPPIVKRIDEILARLLVWPT
jgi:homoserine kinase type II